MRRLITTTARVVVVLSLSVTAALSLSVTAALAAPGGSQGPTVVATINGGGTALMTSGPGAGGKSVSSFGIHATLYSDGTAIGHVDCVDQHGDVSPGNIFGDVTGWSAGGAYGLVTLAVTGTVTGPGGHPVPINFFVTIQSFGGAGMGHWTLRMTPASPFCIELLLSGQIDERLN
jgi:hypothetical protein